MPSDDPDGSIRKETDTVEFTCPACRGQKRPHTHAIGCRQYGLPRRGSGPGGPARDRADGGLRADRAPEPPDFVPPGAGRTADADLPREPAAGAPLSSSDVLNAFMERILDVQKRAEERHQQQIQEQSQ